MTREDFTIFRSIVYSFFFITVSALQIDVYRHVNATKFTDGYKFPNDSAVLYKFMNAEYYSLIRVGSPAKEFKVTFDTTWADSWLPSQHCGLFEIPCMVHTRYDSTQSSSYQEDGRPFSRESKELSLSGFLSIDDFYLPHVHVSNQTFVEITKMSYIPFIMNRADGLIGLAFKSLSINGTLPFFYNFVKQHSTAEQVFTFYMNRSPSTPKAGRLMLGGTDRSHAKGDLLFLPLVESKYWMVHMDRVVVDGKNETKVFCANGCNATFDTSTNLITGPESAIIEINKILKAKEVLPIHPRRYMVDCRTYENLPHIHFVFAGKDHTIESKYYIDHLTWFGFTLCLSPFSPGFENEWVLGGAFLMQYYSEYDFQNSRVGLAETLYEDDPF